METDFKTGNIVHLKSGSPDLKIIAVEGENVLVEWSNKSGDLQRDTFRMICLD